MKWKDVLTPFFLVTFFLFWLLCFLCSRYLLRLRLFPFSALSGNSCFFGTIYWMRASFFILDPDYLLISPYICPAPTSISSCLKPDSPPTHFFPSPRHLTCHTNKWASWTHLPTVEQVEHYLSDSQVQFLIFLVSFLSLFTFSQSEDMLPPQLLGAGDYIYLFMSSGPSTGLAYSRCAINVCWFYVRSPLWSSECLVVFFFFNFLLWKIFRHTLSWENAIPITHT